VVVRVLLAGLLATAACGRFGFDEHDPRGTEPDASTGFDEVPLETWTWVDVPGMVCGNGSPTGIEVNLSRRSSKVLLLLEGGGACWEAAACYGVVIPVAAEHLDGFDGNTFESVRGPLDTNWAMQRGDSTSVFGDASWIFVPYCTGDFHSGTHVATYDVFGPRLMHHVGANNIDAMLARIRMLPASEVFAVGISSGGYGVQTNLDRIAATFPAAVTHVLADGAPLVSFEPVRWSTMKMQWQPRFPAGCTACASGFSDVSRWWKDNLPSPSSRHGLLASLQDQAITLFSGNDISVVNNSTQALASSMQGQQAAFVIDTTNHTLLGLPDTKTSTQVSVRTWVDAWATGTTAFKTVGP